jgi:hypothetical protein
VGGVLLLVNRYVPLGLVILDPIIVNIFFFHLLMAPVGRPLVIVVVTLWGNYRATSPPILFKPVCSANPVSKRH